MCAFICATKTANLLERSAIFLLSYLVFFFLKSFAVSKNIGNGILYFVNFVKIVQVSNFFILLKDNFINESFIPMINI